MFTDRIEAGEKLATALERYRGSSDTIIMGIPTGGVLVGATVARSLGLPFACLGVFRVPWPTRPEATIGTVDVDGKTMWDPHTEMTGYELKKAGDSMIDRIRSDMSRCHEGIDVPDPAGKRVIVVDDEALGWLPAKAGADLLRRHNARELVFATPVIDDTALEFIRPDFVNIVSLHTGSASKGARHYYRHYDLPDTELLSRAVHEVMA